MSEYNGCKNYETWIVGMFINGNYDGEGTCRYFESFFDTAIEEGKRDEESKETVTHYCSDQLKSEVEGIIYGDDESSALTTGIVGDLLRAALCEVDWEEIAESHISDRWDDVEAAV